MRLPHERLRLHIGQEWLTTTGLAFTGSLTLDGTPVAAIRDHGDGHGARFDTADGEPGWPGATEYLNGCRYQGAPVTGQRLLDALIDEHYVSAAVAEAHANRVSVVRLVDDTGRTRVLGSMPPPRDWPARQELARVIADDFAGSSRTGEWQLWGGTGWTYLARVGQHPDPNGSADERDR